MVDLQKLQLRLSHNAQCLNFGKPCIPVITSCASEAEFKVIRSQV